MYFKMIFKFKFDEFLFNCEKLSVCVIYVIQVPQLIMARLELLCINLCANISMSTMLANVCKCLIMFSFAKVESETM